MFEQAVIIINEIIWICAICNLSFVVVVGFKKLSFFQHAEEYYYYKLVKLLTYSFSYVSINVVVSLSFFLIVNGWEASSSGLRVNSESAFLLFKKVRKMFTSSVQKAQTDPTTAFHCNLFYH